MKAKTVKRKPATKAASLKRSGTPACSSRPAGPSGKLVGKPRHLRQVLVLVRENGDYLHLALEGMGHHALITHAFPAASISVPNEVSSQQKPATLVLDIPTVEVVRVFDTVLVNHREHGCVGSFTKARSQWACRTLDDDKQPVLLFRTVEHEAAVPLERHWRIWSDRVAIQWDVSVEAERPAWV